MGEALRSANRHSNGVNWHLGSANRHKFQIGPRYAWFRFRPIKFDFLGIKAYLLLIC